VKSDDKAADPSARLLLVLGMPEGAKKQLFWSVEDVRSHHERYKDDDKVNPYDRPNGVFGEGEEVLWADKQQFPQYDQEAAQKLAAEDKLTQTASLFRDGKLTAQERLTYLTTERNVDPLTANLTAHLGHERFRDDYQQRVVENVLAGKDVLLVAPTGSGKGVCFQLPALMQSAQGVTIVVSPLVALMEDQQGKLNTFADKNHWKGTDEPVAVYLGGRDTRHDMQQLEHDALVLHRYPLVYVAVEKWAALHEQIVALHARKQLRRIVVDEAHCFTSWGHGDFRPKYRELLASLREEDSPLSDVQLVAMTATAAQTTRNDLIDNLFKRPEGEVTVEVRKIFRQNLEIVRQQKTGGTKKDLASFVSRHKQKSDPTIIYAATISEVYKISEWLQQEGIKAVVYHADSNNDIKQKKGECPRKKNHDAFMRDDASVMVATIAYGQGIDKPNVREVIHFGMPKSLEEYMQQIGRAGRDGDTARCTLIADGGNDLARLEGHVNRATCLSPAAEKEKRTCVEYMRRFFFSPECCWRMLQTQFGEDPDAKWSCGCCDHCKSGGGEALERLAKGMPQMSKLTHVVLKVLEMLQVQLNRGVSKKEVKDILSKSRKQEATTTKLHALLELYTKEMGKIKDEKLFAVLDVLSSKNCPYIPGPAGQKEEIKLIETSVATRRFQGGQEMSFMTYKITTEGLVQLEQFQERKSRLSFAVPPQLADIICGQQCRSGSSISDHDSEASEAELELPDALCQECQRDDEADNPLWICEGCSSAYHWDCLGRPSDEMEPTESRPLQWLCPDCLSKYGRKGTKEDKESSYVDELHDVRTNRGTGEKEYQVSFLGGWTEKKWMTEASLAGAYEAVRDEANRREAKKIAELRDEAGLAKEADVSVAADRSLVVGDSSSPPMPFQQQPAIALNDSPMPDSSSPSSPSPPSAEEARLAKELEQKDLRLQVLEQENQQMAKKNQQMAKQIAELMQLVQKRGAEDAQSSAPKRQRTSETDVAAPAAPARLDEAAQQGSVACLNKQRELLASKRQAESRSSTELSKRPRADAAEAPETLEETPWLFQYALQVEFKELDGMAAIEETLRGLLTPQAWSDFINAARADESLGAWQMLVTADVRPGVRMLLSEAERQEAAERGQKAERPKAAAMELHFEDEVGQRAFYAAQYNEDEGNVKKWGRWRPLLSFSLSDVEPLISRVFGEDKVLKIVVPDEPWDANDDAKEAWKRWIRAGVTVLGRTFKYFTHRTEHKITDTKVFMVAVPAPGEAPFKVRGWRAGEWSTPQEARLLLGDFDSLNQIGKVEKRLKLVCSGTCPVLAGREFVLLQGCKGGTLTYKATKDATSGVTTFEWWCGATKLEDAPDGKVNVVIIADDYGTGKDASGQRYVMTDGCGLISPDLALEIPMIASGRPKKGEKVPGEPGFEAAAATQMRLYVGGLVAKGVVQTAPLPRRTIMLRSDTMVKVWGNADSRESMAQQRGFAALEVNNTADGANARVVTNVDMIPLLHHGAKLHGEQQGSKAEENMVNYLIDKQATQKKEAEMLVSKVVPAADKEKVLSNSRGAQRARPGQVRATASERLKVGIDPNFDVDTFKLLVESEMSPKLQKLQQGKLELPSSGTFMGVADWTGSLEEGQVCILQHGNLFGPDSAVRGAGAKREVLLYKSPGCHVGDIRKVENVRPDAIVQYLSACNPRGDGTVGSWRRCNLLIFSKRGARPLADMMSGSDHDGDQFSVIADPNVVDNFAESPAWVAPPPSEAKQKKEEALKPEGDAREEQLTSYYYQQRFVAGSEVGKATFLRNAVIDRFGADHWLALQLVDFYYAGLDGCTNRLPQVHFIDDRRSDEKANTQETIYVANLKKWPKWLQLKSKRSDVTWVDSPPDSLMGKLYQACDVEKCTRAALEQPPPQLQQQQQQQQQSTHASTYTYAFMPSGRPKVQVDPDLDLRREAHEQRFDFEKCVVKWGGLFKLWRDEYSRVYKDPTAPDESDARRRHAGEINQRYIDMMECTHVDPTARNRVFDKNRLEYEASALYVACYGFAAKKQAEDEQTYKTKLEEHRANATRGEASKAPERPKWPQTSFAWSIAGPQLLEIKRTQNDKRQTQKKR